MIILAKIKVIVSLNRTIRLNSWEFKARGCSVSKDISDRLYTVPSVTQRSLSIPLDDSRLLNLQQRYKASGLIIMNNAILNSDKYVGVRIHTDDKYLRTIKKIKDGNLETKWVYESTRLEMDVLTVSVTSPIIVSSVEHFITVEEGQEYLSTIPGIKESQIESLRNFKRSMIPGFDLLTISMAIQ